MRSLTRVSLSFAIGYVLLSTAGILGMLLRIDPIVLQVCMTLLGAILCASHYIRKRSDLLWTGMFDGDDWIVLGVGTLYLITGILFFDRLVMWMGGDALAHAELVRMLIDGQRLPVGLPAIGSYWEQYPKGFHYYSYLWARGFPILNLIQTIPIVITAATPILLYSIVREMRQDAVAAYAFILACLVFPMHYSYLIWGGYPSAAAEMLLVSTVLAVVVGSRTFVVLLLGILLSHGRLLAIALGVLFGWVLTETLRRRLTDRYMSVLLPSFVILVGILLYIHRPEYLASVFSDRYLASEFIARWYPTFLGCFGVMIAIARRENLDRLVLAWAGAVILIVLLVDTGPLRFIGTADRILLELYLPLSILAGLALCRMAGGDTKLKASFLIVLIITGLASMSVIFYSYAGVWGLPQEDYEAIMWLSDQNFSDAVCINLDETGAWIYPITGIKATWPRVDLTGIGSNLAKGIAKDPADATTLEKLKSISDRNIFIYLSSVSIARPEYVPPFSEYLGAFPRVNLSFPETNYELLYDRGARIYRVRA